MSRPVDQHWEESDYTLMGRVLGADGTRITQASISSIAAYVFDYASGEQVGATLAPAVSDSVFNTLQTDARWTEDSTGYNFRITVPGSYFATGNAKYRVETVLTPVSGSVFPGPVRIVFVRNLLSR